MSFIASFLISLALNVVAYAIAPKPKQEKPPAAKDMEDPTVSSGRPIPVVFGTVRVQGLNLLWFGEKEKVLLKMTDSGGKK